MTNIGQRVRRKCKPRKMSKAFSTLTAIDPVTGNMLPEQFHYVYDTQGRPVEATYAMTPQTWTPSNGGSYYDAAHKAATRGRTHYDYDAKGRPKGVYNWWDTWNSGSSSYTSAPIRANECVYETSGLKRGTKTQSKFYNVVGNVWNLQRTELFGYHSKNDYLTSANYGDGLPNVTANWTYDDGGNRASDSTNSGTWTYDNLNRMTTSPGITYTNDILGNRLTKATMSYTWDDVNRLTGLTNGGNNVTSYRYRADGMRVTKSVSSSGGSTEGLTRYRYDSQLSTESISRDSNGAITEMTRNALGARGIDMVSKAISSGISISYPIYDAHGNNVGMLSKTGGSWSLSDERTYDGWGQVRSGASVGGSSSRFCAEIGHTQDDESGLIYMKARYYDPLVGGFLSEDTGRQSINWKIYCGNDPINRMDASGNDFLDRIYFFGGWAAFIIGNILALGGAMMCSRAFTLGQLAAGIEQCVMAVFLIGLGAGIATTYGTTDKKTGIGELIGGVIASKCLEGLLKQVTSTIATMASHFVGGVILCGTGSDHWLERSEPARNQC